MTIGLTSLFGCQNLQINEGIVVDDTVCPEVNYSLLKPTEIEPWEGGSRREMLSRCIKIEGDLKRCNADKLGAVEKPQPVIKP